MEIHAHHVREGPARTTGPVPDTAAETGRNGRRIRPTGPSRPVEDRRLAQGDDADARRSCGRGSAGRLDGGGREPRAPPAPCPTSRARSRGRDPHAPSSRGRSVDEAPDRPRDQARAVERGPRCRGSRRPTRPLALPDRHEVDDALDVLDGAARGVSASIMSPAAGSLPGSRARRPARARTRSARRRGRPHAARARARCR